MVVNHHLDDLQSTGLTKRRGHGDDLAKLMIGCGIGIGRRSVLSVGDMIHNDVAVEAVDTVGRKGDAKGASMLDRFLPRDR